MKWRPKPAKEKLPDVSWEQAITEQRNEVKVTGKELAAAVESIKSKRGFIGSADVNGVNYTLNTHWPLEQEELKL